MFNFKLPQPPQSPDDRICICLVSSAPLVLPIPSCVAPLVLPVGPLLAAAAVGYGIRKLWDLLTD